MLENTRINIVNGAAHFSKDLTVLQESSQGVKVMKKKL
jgi:hypothetical protein